MDKRDDFLPFSRPDVGEDEIARVVKVLRSGWLTAGPETASFEGEFAKFCGAPHAVAVSSGTAGMHLLLLALGIGAGDEIITPSMTFASTVNQISLLGAVPVFVDCDYGTLNMDSGALEARITSRTKAVIPVHFAGVPCDLDPIRKVARQRGLAVIEDAAHAVGTEYRGAPVGSGGNPAVFSFHPIKNITLGEGGMVTVSDDALDHKLRLLRFHGIERDAWKRYGKGGTPDYDVAAPGYKYNLTDIQAALGRGQLARVGAMNRRRRVLAERYLSSLASVPGLDLPEVPPYPFVHSWHLFIVKVNKGPRDRFISGLKERNIGCGVHFPPCHLLSYVREKFGKRQGKLPETERAGSRVVSLPLFPGMKDEDVDYVAAAAREVLGSAAEPGG